MTSYKGRVALVTGASSGIGAAIAEQLVQAGLIVVGAARRVERIQELSKRLAGKPGRLIARKLDVSKENEIVEIFKWIESEVGGVDVLVNNAALLVYKPICGMTVEEMRNLSDVNFLSVLIASKEALNSMTRRKITDGYIVNINSIAGHEVPCVPGVFLSFYPSTKYAMTAACQSLRDEIRQSGSKTRVTSISPGGVATEMTEDFAKSGLPVNLLNAHDVASAVTYVLSTPTTVEITELTIRPTGESLAELSKAITDATANKDSPTKTT